MDWLWQKKKSSLLHYKSLAFKKKPVICNLISYASIKRLKFYWKHIRSGNQINFNYILASMCDFIWTIYLMLFNNCLKLVLVNDYKASI